jgi:hypothetical protein
VFEGVYGHEPLAPSIVLMVDRLWANAKKRIAWRYSRMFWTWTLSWSCEPWYQEMAATVDLRHPSSIVDADIILSGQAMVLAEVGCVEVAVTNPRRSFRLVDARRRQEAAPARDGAVVARGSPAWNRQATMLRWSAMRDIRTESNS